MLFVLAAAVVQIKDLQHLLCFLMSDAHILISAQLFSAVECVSESVALFSWQYRRW